MEQIKGTDLLDDATKMNFEEDKKMCTEFLAREFRDLEKKRDHLEIQEERFQGLCDMTVPDLAKHIEQFQGGRRC